MSAIEALKKLLDEAETRPEEQLVELSVPVDIVLEILAWAEKAQGAVNHNSRLVEEERIRHELYRRDGEISGLRYALEKILEKGNGDDGSI